MAVAAYPLFQAALDALAWALSIWLAVAIRLNIDIPDIDKKNLVKFIPIAVGVQISIGLIIGLYRRRWRYGSFEEAAALAIAAVTATAVLYVVDRNFLHPRLAPLSAVIVGGFVGLTATGAIRYAWRLGVDRLRRPSGPGVVRTLVFGAGDGGVQVINAMLSTPNSPYLPVGIIDDDPTKRRLAIRGVAVLGGKADLAAIALRVDAEVLLVAIPSANSDLIAELTDASTACGLSLRVLPPVDELFDHAPGVADIRPLTETDLLGRHQISTDIASISGYLTGKRVLVTGAGGSIGSELCRQLHRLAPAELMMLDRDESALHQVQLSIEGKALLDTPNVILADLRDEQRIIEIFNDRRPQVVFHAAALKHLPLLEQYPHEAYKSNVIGSLNVLEAARATGVERFVNISTDKAANPCSVLGYSKRLAERLTAHVAERASGTYLSVRFGNVIGSRGSVLHTFRQQIEDGGPITVTDPNVTRFFMTIPEAVQLVIQAGAIGDDGEVLILDMGKPVRIDDVARRLASQSKRPIKIVYTGLRPGEKLDEELLGDDEVDVRPKHPLISHAPVPALDPADVVGVENPDVHWMAAMCSVDLPTR